MEVQLSLTLDEVNAVLGIMGELPTKSGAFPLLMKIKGQAEACVKSQQAPQAVQSEE